MRNKHKIAIIVGNTDFVYELRELLYRLGYECVQPVSAKQAYRMLVSDGVDLLLTELSAHWGSTLPLLSGIREKNQSLKIVMLTNPAETIEAGMMERFNISAILEKPLEDLIDLKEILDKELSCS